jgi:hypothetical protein
VEVLAMEALSLSLLKQNDFDIIKEAALKRDAKLSMGRSVGKVAQGQPMIQEDARESAIYEEDGRRVMSVVIRLLDKKMV